MAASSCVAPCPKRAVRPINLAAVRAECAGYELPSRRNNCILALVLPRGGIAVLVGQTEKRAIIANRGLFRGISLDAPATGEGSRPRVGRKLSGGFPHTERKNDRQHRNELDDSRILRIFGMFHGLSPVTNQSAGPQKGI